ncbi:MAG: ubiquinone/menaquinone biosynthesis methyltransferase [Desulfovibrio sp.]|nr:ubiquinone/menaquinone biosynthesis methyltransferase [Desulfovibrio sp.]
MQPSAHDSAVAGMFGGIARFYDLLNHVLSLGIDYYWRHELAAAVRPGREGVVLDLAAGTLDVSLAIRRRFPQVTVPALDFCPPMLRLGLPKLQGENARRIIPVAADAKKLPLPDESINCLTIAFGIRNIQPRSEALAEMLRVLKPQGRACILEFGSGSERIFGGLYNCYLKHLLPVIGRLFSKDKEAYSYLARTICEFPKAELFEQEMRQAGFVKTSYRKLTGGIVCLHLGEKDA